MSRVATEIEQALAKLTPDERLLVERKIQRIRIHRSAVKRFPTPAHLGQFFRPGWVQTPMLDAIDRAIMRAESRTAPRQIVNTPPQEGKSSRLQDGCAWMLLRNPTLRIVFASYEQGIAARSGLEIRQQIEQHGSGYRGQTRDPDRVDSLGLMLDPDRGLQTNWSLADVPGAKNKRPGGVLSVGIGSSFTGRPADVLIIDDPFKDPKQADSPHYRQTVRDWYRAVANARLDPRGIIIVVQCMTGDTPVLMADGRQKPLRDVRPGDEVATYENGSVTTSTVRNWANQGPDAISSIRMRSGRVVRANARHPFLTVENGEHVWRRTDELRPGSVIQTVTGGSGEVSPAPKTGATRRPNARGGACPTTTSTVGPPESDRRRSIQRAGVPPISSTGTALLSKTTRRSLRSRTVDVPSVASALPVETLARTGMASCALTMTTTLAESEGSSVTTATSRSDTASQRPGCAPLPTTYRPELDEVLSVSPCGVEDVFDLQIERTENFIANGLVSHNTRWHEDDLTGWLLAEDAVRDEPRWEQLNVPAQAETNDPLGRVPGEYLESARAGRDADAWKQIKIDVGTRWWNALYQGRPSAPEGGIFKRKWFDDNRVDGTPEITWGITFIDPADNEGSGDEAGIISAGLGVDGDIYVLADDSGHYTVAQWVRAALYAMIRNNTAQLCYEQSLSGLKRHIDHEWKMVYTQARALSETHRKWSSFANQEQGWPGDPNPLAIEHVTKQLAGALDTRDERRLLEKQLIDLWPHVQSVLSMPSTGPSVKAIPARGSKTVRATMVSPMYERGRVHHVGHFPDAENQMATWIETQDSPDRMDALVHALTELSKTGGPGQLMTAPSTPAVTRRQRQMPAVLRSTRR